MIDMNWSWNHCEIRTLFYLEGFITPTWLFQNLMLLFYDDMFWFDILLSDLPKPVSPLDSISQQSEEDIGVKYFFPFFTFLDI